MRHRLLIFLAVMSASGSGCAIGSSANQIAQNPATGLRVVVVASPQYHADQPVSVDSASVRAALLASGNFVDADATAVADPIGRELLRLTRNQRLALLSTTSEYHLFARGGALIIVRLFDGQELNRSEYTFATQAASSISPSALATEGKRQTDPPVIIVAVFRVEDANARIDREALDQLTDYLSAKLTETAGYRVVPKNQLRQRLIEKKAEGYKTCFDETCQIALGKAVAAQKSLATKLLRVGGQCMISATLYDLRTETTERAASLRTSCAEAALIDGMDHIVKKLAR